MGYYTCSGACWGCYGTSPYAPTTQPPAKKKAPETAPAPKKEPDKKTGQARLIVDVPAEAKLFIDDQLMKTPSARRVFNTPALDPDQTYYYIIRAELTRKGKEYAKTTRVLLRAGETARASFSDLGLASTEKPKPVASAQR
jgi:uncharacterized protein (TIGR03000 family)